MKKPAISLRQRLDSVLPTPFVLRVILGSMFILSFASKGTDVTRFNRLTDNILASSPKNIMLSELSASMGLIILLVELVIGVLLLSGIGIRLSAILSIIILSVFTLITLNIAGTVSAGDCGCFGILLPRSTSVSVIENILFMIIGISLWIKAEKVTKPNFKLASMFILGGVLWMSAFYYFPPAWSALRVGSAWVDFSAVPSLPEEDSFLIWIMSPECLDCQEKTDFINQVADQNEKLFAITNANQGRIAEYYYDWSPHFDLHRITDKRMKLFGLNLGTLIRINNGVVTNIWTLNELELSEFSVHKGNRGH